MNLKAILKKLAVLISTGAVYTMSNITAFAADTAAADDASVGVGALVSTFLLPILMLIFLYFIMIRPQQKQEREIQEMQKNLQVGDEVITKGGIVGFVLRVEDAKETVVLETGSDRLKIRILQSAIARNVTAEEAAAQEKAQEQKEKANRGITAGKPKDE